MATYKNKNLYSLELPTPSGYTINVPSTKCVTGTFFSAYSSLTLLSNDEAAAVPSSDIVFSAPNANTSASASLSGLTGTQDGDNVTFTCPPVPGGSVVNLFQNGLLLAENIDYTRISTTITFTTAPAAEDILLIEYLS